MNIYVCVDVYIYGFILGQVGGQRVFFCHEKLSKINLEFRHPQTLTPPKKKIVHYFFIFATVLDSSRRDMFKSEEFFCFSNFFRRGRGSVISQLSRFALHKIILKINFGMTPEKKKKETTYLQKLPDNRKLRS